jgi:hypothetical protein
MIRGKGKMGKSGEKAALWARRLLLCPLSAHPPFACLTTCTFDHVIDAAFDILYVDKDGADSRRNRRRSQRAGNRCQTRQHKEKL